MMVSPVASVASPHHQQPKPIAPKMQQQQQQQQQQQSPDAVSSSTNSFMGTSSAAGTGAATSGAAALRGCRRKIAFHPTLGYAIAPPQPAKVARRNARERNRVKQVSKALFNCTDTHLVT